VIEKAAAEGDASSATTAAADIATASAEYLKSYPG
jgi:hypothetical protein